MCGAGHFGAGPFPSLRHQSGSPVFFRFGLSQRGLLHFGQTDGLSTPSGFSLLPRGNQTCPHLHRHPVNCTIPIGFSSGFFMGNLSVVILIIYQYYIPLPLTVNYRNDIL
jgi:hypothetical protein